MKKLAKFGILLFPALMGATTASLQSGDKPVPLYDADTKLEPDTVIDTPTALITRFADRVRDRHARENMFHAYDHFVALYWERRTVTIEIVDRIAKGGDSVTYNMTSLFPLNKPNLRLFFEGKGTVAQYTDNLISNQVDPLHYTVTLKVNTNEHRPLKLGDRIESEFSPFLLPPVEGRTNYYGTVFLYVVGRGITPWEGRGPLRDSFPMPDAALLGGAMTVHQPNSDEPKEHFKQFATNMAPIDAQPFVLGRRLFHTNFKTGEHTEPGNPIFKEEVGKLGPRFAEVSCVACHVNDGRALPPAVGKTMQQYAMHVGSDAFGAPDPNLGSMLQPQSISGPSEGSMAIANWTTINGTYGDGTAYSLQKPVYKFNGPTPAFFSPHIAPQLVGQGLLEAIDESDIMARAAEQKSRTDGIHGHIQLVADSVNGETRIGRFGWKAGAASLKQQIAAAFRNDMGVTNSIYPKQDQGAAEPVLENLPPKLSDTDLENMYRYVATLGVQPRRDLNDAEALKGETLFASANCVECHAANVKTGPHHPMAELRNQTIHPYTDLLLHNMGPGLADNMGEGRATGADWRTAPLWSVGSTAGVSGGEAYLHDGRARTLNEAILWHGGEAEKSKETFRNMSADDRAALIKFLKSL